MYVRVYGQVFPYAIPFLRGLETLNGSLDLSDQDGRFPVASADGIFARLATITGDLIVKATQIASLSGVFGELRAVGSE